MTLRALVIMFVLGAVTPHARADDPKATAKLHIANATAFHEQRHWRKALDELNIAYTLDPQPELLYAIAQLHVALGDCPQAITFYERFIASKPTEAREAVARKAIAICKTNPPPPEPSADDEQPARPPTPPPQPVVIQPAPAPQPQESPWYRDSVGDALVGGGIVAGVIALVMYRSALSDLDAANIATTYPDQTKLYDQAQTSRTFALVFGAGGLALVGAGLFHYVVHDRGERAHIAVVPATGGALVTWSGGF
jgi:hypothetical protein